MFGATIGGHKELGHWIDCFGRFGLLRHASEGTLAAVSEEPNLPLKPLVIARPVVDQMVAHAIAGIPDEACGMFAADLDTGEVVKFYPLTNVAKSSQIYQIDGPEFMATEQAADEAGLLIVGVMHSHTHTTNYPSPTDIADAANFDPFGSWHFIIVSLKHADPSVRSYKILDGQVTEEPIEVASN